ncbi:hypothetical protein PHLCEN_2v8837 [Hermanssonia centrifuga]|uniref:Ribosome biogenesis protein SLX9 n=1 Tax=Hermanssonia centrifuga TaxID=98765 RepID=A0A2R6NTE9_9APHY|nr:hypothetical protein PHLCEN_2v8837 [Hermanssonia centrifuga]
MKKKEKQMVKHELFLQTTTGLESSRSPYSKSHERRLRRKAKEEVAGGLGNIKAAISAVEEDIPTAVQKTIQQTVSQDDDDMINDRTSAKKSTLGQIGEGKHVPLTKSQRKRTLQTERLRIPMILSNAEFHSNPFQTIRTHAQNTLLTHNKPAS